MPEINPEVTAETETYLTTNTSYFANGELLYSEPEQTNPEPVALSDLPYTIQLDPEKLSQEVSREEETLKWATRAPETFRYLGLACGAVIGTFTGLTDSSGQIRGLVIGSV
jgi:hypothetical protein